MSLAGARVGRKALLVAGAALLPVTILTAYFAVTRGQNLRLPESVDFIAMIVGCALGAFCLWQLIHESRWKHVSVLAYLAGMGILKFAFAFAFVCSIYDDCL